MSTTTSVPNTGTLIVIAGFLLVIGYLYYRRAKTENQEPFAPNDLLTDLTAKAGQLEQVIGMDEVIERLIHIIARKQKNNPLLIGEPGVGKTAAVEGLAQRIARGDVPASFVSKRVLALHLGDLVSGTKYRGELEQRLRHLLTSLEAKPREVILFIDELHMIEQARGGEGSIDIADILKPALSRGELQVIGATTWKEYEQYLKPDTAIERRFQPVLVEEPSRDSAIQILQGVKTSYEKFHQVCIPDESITAAVDASMQFIKDRFLPDKALDLIDEACAKVSIEGPHHHACAFGLIHAAAAHAKATCPGDDEPVVTPQDVEEIAHQWQTHRSTPQT